ncbi:MAG TPA: hypothetical protein VMB85_26255 [Bryobacteraceae bacterium]|jgi:hypothetical protein|nr:hypothetical protein [Bryobacteraceae bacterium]
MIGVSFVSAVLVFFALWFIYLVLCYSRARLLPQCWKCGAAKVRRSHFHGFLDTVAAISLLSPFRCSGCRSRFYALRLARSHPLT